jgi:DNA invertase Pin-like site-specific DNA recombinase
MNNQESRQLQQGLKQRAIQFGWPSENVEIIDSDLGFTGTNAEQRQGFQYLLTQIALGNVGIVFSYDVTRLSRNCSDWYPLLDICSYKKTLIGDREGIYDPRTPNGRLLLGLKGQFAEIELNTIRARMNEGLLNKAKRGDLILQLPTGYVYAQSIVSKDPNLEIQNCIQTIFDQFLRLRSASKVLRFFNDNQLRIPRYVHKELLWKKSTVAAILSVLKNPAYAGASVYGRTQTSIVDFSSKKKEQRKLPIEKWKYVVKDKFPSYITWDNFEIIQGMLKDNYAEYDRNQSRGIPRPGKALLHGIIHCGACGHKMVVQYKGGTRYICNHLRQQNGSPVCQYLPADYIDDYVADAFLQAISPIELNAYEKIVENQWRETSTVNKMKEQQLERLRYQARLAERQFNQVDPDNRLVAAELERRWEVALQEFKAAEIECKNEKTKRTTALLQLPTELQETFLNIGERLPKIWKDLASEKKKSFLRCLIDKVVVHRKERYCLEVRVVWQGGETTTKEISIPIKRFKELPFAKKFEEKVIELVKLGHKDETVAEMLTTEGYRSAMHQHVVPSTVQAIRLKHGVMMNRHQSHPRRIAGFLTVPQLAKQFSVPVYQIYYQIEMGRIKADKDLSTGLYLFPDTEDTVKMFEACLDRANKKIATH